MFDNLTVGRVINHAQQRIDLHPLERSQTSGLGEFLFFSETRDLCLNLNFIFISFKVFREQIFALCRLARCDDGTIWHKVTRIPLADSDARAHTNVRQR
jgi:hypothetical protein